MLRISAIAFFTAILFALGFFVISEAPDANAETDGAEAACSGARFASLASTVTKPDSLPGPLPPQSADEAPAEVHSQWTRTCEWYEYTYTVSRRTCNTRRVNEGGGYYSYVSYCYSYDVERTRRWRGCYREWREHQHTMLPRDPFGQAVNTA